MARERADEERGARPTAVQPNRSGRRWLLRFLRVALAIFLVFLALLLLGLWHIGVFGGNLRTVVPGQFYRSAQLTHGNLESALRTDHIATVINLRGREADDAWYRNEVQVCRKMGVAHDDISFSATSLPPPRELNKLIHDLDTARYPVLVHCMGGADRSGLASTLYLVLYRGQPLNNAEQAQLALRYGHLGYRWNRAYAMDEFFNLYRRTSGGLGLRQWILQKYPSVYQELHS